MDNNRVSRCSGRGTFALFSWVMLNLILTLFSKYMYCSGIKLPVYSILIGTTCTLVVFGSWKMWVLFRARNFKHEKRRYTVLGSGERRPVSASVMDQQYYAGGNMGRSRTTVMLDAAAPYAKHFRVLFLIGGSHGLASALEAIAIVSLGLSTNQIIKALGPLLTLAVALSRNSSTQQVSMRLRWCTGLVVVGCGLAVFHNPGFDFLGVVLTLVSLVIGTYQVVASEKLLQASRDERLSPTGIAVATSIPGVFILAILFAVLEGSHLSNFPTGAPSTCENFTPIALGTGFALVTLSGLFAAMYNAAHYMLLAETSAHYFVMTGNAKVILIVLCGEALFPSGVLGSSNPYRAWNIIGFILAIVGYCAYNYFKLIEKSQPDDNTIEIVQLEVFDGDEPEDDSQDGLRTV